MLPVFASSTRRSVLYILNYTEQKKSPKSYLNQINVQRMYISKNYAGVCYRVAGLSLCEHAANNNSMIESTIESIMYRFSYCAASGLKGYSYWCIRIREFKYCVR